LILHQLNHFIFGIDSNQFTSIWNCRETVVEGFLKEGKTLKYDFSLPIDKFDTFVSQVREKSSGDALTGGYGHIGDGNIHVMLIL